METTESITGRKTWRNKERITIGPRKGQFKKQKAVKRKISDDCESEDAASMVSVSSDVRQEVPKSKTKIIKKKGMSAVDPSQSESSSADEMSVRKCTLLPSKEVCAKKSCISNVTVKKNVSNLKQPMPNTVNQREIIQKNTNSDSKKEEELCKEMLDQLNKCNKHVLFGLLVKEMEAEQILKGYKAKRNTWFKKDIQEEAARVLDIKLDNRVELNKSATDTAKKISSLEKVLQELPNFVDSSEQFTEMVLETYGHQLNAVKVFELLKHEEVIKVVAKKFSAEDVMDLFRQSDNRTLNGQILEMASVDDIAHEIKRRNDLESSQMLLKVLLEMPSEINSSCSTSTSNVEAGYTRTIIDVINSKKYLKTSESILSFMLQNVQEIRSKETEKNIKNLINKLDPAKLVDMLHAAVKRSLDKNKNMSFIDISDVEIFKEEH